MSSHEDWGWDWDEKQEAPEEPKVKIPEIPSPEEEKKNLRPFVIAGGATAVGLVITGGVVAWRHRKKHEGK